MATPKCATCKSAMKPFAEWVCGKCGSTKQVPRPTKKELTDAELEAARAEGQRQGRAEALGLVERRLKDLDDLPSSPLSSIAIGELRWLAQAIQEKADA